MIKRVVKALAYAALAMVLAVAGFAAYVQLTGIPRYAPKPVRFVVDSTPERVERGKRFVTMLCAGCHNDPATAALTGRLMADAPPKFGVIYSPNITQDREFGIGAWSDAELAYLIRTGITRDGRYTPPWMLKLPLLADEDLKDVIAFLRSDDPLVRARPVADRAPEPSFFTKFLTHVAFKPLPYPDKPVVAPDPTDSVAYGRYLMVGKLDCYACHSKDFATVDALVPEASQGFLGGGNSMRDRDDHPVFTANLTPDATGIGAWTEADFRRTLKLGLRPDGRPLRSPMTARPELTDDELHAIWVYLRTVPPIVNAVPSPYPEPEIADAGRRVFHKYGCNSCHGNDGAGTVDFRRGLSKYATDAALVDYIKHPERTKPGIAMPTWDGTIEEGEYAALARYVRTLAVVPGS